MLSKFHMWNIPFPKLLMKIIDFDAENEKKML